MQVRFLLGPAGSGKTFRCLAEIRQELLADPAGSPLLLLAPKQATFQLERQLLSHPDLYGYTRLQILSFDRLAQYILRELGANLPEPLDDQGRVMVLRALLSQHRSRLRVFHTTARLPGFATRLSLLLRELQHEQISPRQLLALAEKISGPEQLRDKLHDFALLLRSYLDWLEPRGLLDAEDLLNQATTLLRTEARLPAGQRRFQLAGLWMDGFAELTAQELDLLSALAPLSSLTTLAFCLPDEITDEPSWLSTWSVIGQTYLRCRQRLADVTRAQTSVESLSQQRRFTSPDLAHLEHHWANPERFAGPCATITPFSCATPEDEVTLAARQISHFVRDGGRYRETAVLVRSLDRYADIVRRVFTRYEIPFFLDRREPVTHHPLAELTRYALRLAAYDWQTPDWFGALKTGLVDIAEDDVDWLENLALEFGWTGNTWTQALPVPERPTWTERAERLRNRVIPPFVTVAKHAAQPLTGVQLAHVIREFWTTLNIARSLDQWNTRVNASSSSALQHQTPHATVFDQMHAWLDNLERAFPTEALSVRDWLPILEAGLANLSIGVIPPTIDQVLVGAIDRSRNPDLKLVLVLGLNEGIFPARPREDALLNELERDALNTAGARLGSNTRRRLGHEWFYGYIAVTRASQQLVLTYAQTDSRGNKLNPSPFFTRLAELFPELSPQPWRPPPAFTEVEHVSEITAPAIRLAEQVTRHSGNVDAAEVAALLSLPQLTPAITKARQLAAAHDQLSPALAERLHGPELATSVSALENFAACPFKFFIGHGLRASERKLFELDARERGSFQHEVLSAFHGELLAEKLRWRDLTPDAARVRVRRLGENLLPNYRNGLMNADAGRRFAAETLLRSLETLIAVLVGWMRDYQFDPALVEVGFGLKNTPWPAWRLELNHGHALLLRGRIDRVDVWRDPATNAALAVVMDYKSSSRKPDRLKLEHGLQLQLPAYLAALEQLPEAHASLGAQRLVPAGVFYVNLRGEFASAKSRADVLADRAEALRKGYTHFGRFDAGHIQQLDPRGESSQFKTGGRAYDRMNSSEFRELLNRAVENLVRFGDEIYSGVIAPTPFRKGGETACDFCEYTAICRFDPWVQPFRSLQTTKE